MQVNPRSQYILASYNTKNMSLADALFLIKAANKRYDFRYPADYGKLKELCYELSNYMIAEKLTETAFYTELKKKINNFRVLDFSEGHHLKEANFYHMVGVLDIGADFISMKYTGNTNRFASMAY